MQATHKYLVVCVVFQVDLSLVLGRLLGGRALCAGALAGGIGLGAARLLRRRRAVGVVVRGRGGLGGRGGFTGDLGTRDSTLCLHLQRVEVSAGTDVKSTLKVCKPPLMYLPRQQMVYSTYFYLARVYCVRLVGKSVVDRCDINKCDETKTPGAF